ncbi:mitochondrial tRNA-specific 2-thiouridylase 1 isoform X2 [Zootermopsis nevadensis]|uniref:mitochondrial tRNA-specific 2-thiouridylase 1 isoform X2 n=1 Tax=Zootermopsis nevadensis TaxID=136037 RepID=UPI000B8EDAC0|nr:mitochondrial tRNA-specific 2-thiouridylase 1 isoform X2 [Zootermopsis nevadensis]
MSNIGRVIVAVSGGVDSAVAALFLKRKGFDVVGVFMENWDVTDEMGICSVAQDAEDAQWVCSRLDIPFHHVSFVKEYWHEVFCLLKDYGSGYTPNPDILCNRQIKFDTFYRYAKDKMDANAIATGHYARTTFGSFLENYDPVAGVHLLKPVDLFKDQTFFLSQVPQMPLQRTMFPLGNLTKNQVRRIACEHEMYHIVKKKESRGICFIGSRNFRNFISEYLVDKPGNFRDIDNGHIVGKHSGIHQWTIGQRCRIGGQVKPYFVARKDPKSDDILVASGTNHPSLFIQFFFAAESHWIHSVPEPLMLEGIFECEFRFQHTKPLVKCTLVAMADNQVLVKLVRPLRAITLGQYAVFYKGKECLGSARITLLGPSLQSLGHGEQNGCLVRGIVYDSAVHTVDVRG